MKLMRQHPELHSGKYPEELVAIAGASAGGINALVSAMSWCMDDDRMQGIAEDAIDNNLFRDLWLNVGFINLLPENASEYGHEDGLLSRRAFKEVIQQISDLLDQPIYRSDCAIPVALTVTRTEPVVMEVGGIRVRNQRFVIPFILKSLPSEPGKIILQSYLEGRSDKMLGNVIYLQSITNNQITLAKESIFSAVLASSAFPVAFGRVKLNYCLQQDDVSSSTPASGLCPINYSPTSGDFIDGGIFDNVPLGVARAFTELHPKPADTQYNYIYLDPASRRPLRKLEDSSQSKSGGYGLTSQLSFLSGAITSGEQYELYNVLRSDDWTGKDNRRILLTTRHPPITGEFLAHFGAFIDVAFREYDYYAGVYDGIINIAQYHCYRQNSLPSQKNSQCLATQARAVYEGLFSTQDHNVTHQIAYAVLAQLAHHEFYNTSDRAKWDWAWNDINTDIKSNILLVSTNLIATDYKDPDNDPVLHDFIAALPNNYDLTQADFIIKRILKLRNEDELKWFYPLASRASQRLLELEKHEESISHDSFRGLMGLAAFGVESSLADGKDFVWNQSTALNSWYQLLPYELAYDVSNTGWSLSWEPSWKFNSPWSLNTKITPYARQQSYDEHTVFNQIDFFISHQNKSSLFSSWGIGPSYNHQRQSHLNVDRENYGATAYVGFFGNKLRLTYGKRAESGGFFGDAIYLYIGITDIPGMTYWTKNTYW